MNQLSIFDRLELLNPEMARKAYSDFFNTIGLSGPELKAAKVTAGLQDSLVLSLYRELGKMTPLACWRAYCRRFPECPATSIRRSVNTLTGLKMLQKTDEMVKEQFGQPNYLWQIVEP